MAHRNLIITLLFACFLLLVLLPAGAGGTPESGVADVSGGRADLTGWNPS